MEIDFIKWMVGYAEGFDSCGDVIRHIRSGQMLHSNKITNWYFYPLLLQRAIEGVNRKDGYIKIVQGWTCKDGNHVTISDMKNYIPFKTWAEDKGDNLDRSKEQALKYKCKQEAT